MKKICHVQKPIFFLIAIALCMLGTTGCNRHADRAAVEKPKEDNPNSEKEASIAPPEPPGSELPDCVKNETEAVSQSPLETQTAAIEKPPAASEMQSAASGKQPNGKQPSGKQPSGTAMPNVEPAMQTAPESWSVKRILALSMAGPVVIDIMANIEGKSLDHAAQASAMRAISTITKDMEKPWKWPDIIDHPLVSSGWLGNLVPDGEQRDGLIKMYNKDGDEEVDDEELLSFLSRGLSSGPAFRFSDINTRSNAFASRTPWEHLDSSVDSTLDRSEIANLDAVVWRFDLNGDRVLTLAELQASAAEDAMELTSMSAFVNPKSTIEVDADKKPRQSVAALLDHYTAFNNITRDQWLGWSDKRWKQFDKNGDMEVSKDELELVQTVAADLTLKVRFQLEANSTSLAASIDEASDLKWFTRLDNAGQAIDKSIALAVTVRDSFTTANRARLREQLAAALANPQIEMFFRAQFQLKEKAFDILDADSDDKLSDEEFENAWDWLTSIRGSRILARFMVAESSWFRMADVDADNRLTEAEVQKLPIFLTSLDRDNDGVVTPSEMPLTVRLEIARSDERLQNFLPPPAENSKVEMGWFAASDSNNDNSLSKAEFLGSSEDFSAYDVDNDGFITQTEAYKSSPPRVQ